MADAARTPSLDRGSYLTGFRLLVDRCDPNVIGGFGRDGAARGRGHRRPCDGRRKRRRWSRSLLDAGARMDVRDELLKSTPLGWACRWGRAVIVRILLERGADPLEPDAETWATPRAWAEKMNRFRSWRS